MNSITLSQKFTGPAVGLPGEAMQLAGQSLLVQTSPGCIATIYGSNLPNVEASWQSIGTASGYAGTALTSSFAFVRVATDVAGVVAISAVSGSGSGGGGGSGSSDTTEATQLLVKAAAQAAAAGVGAINDAMATSDAGSFSLVALAKRALANWTTLLSRTPALTNGRTPVDTDRVVKQLIDAPSGTVTYVCEANTVGAATSAAVWRIKRITVSGTTTMIQWGGTGAFDQIADNRATTVVYA